MFHSAPTSTFRCDSHEVAGDVVRLWLGGEIGRDDAQTLDDALRGAQAAAAITIVDVRAVTAIDSTVLHLIRAAARRARSQERRLVILRAAGSLVPAFDELYPDARVMTTVDPPAESAVAPAPLTVATDERGDLSVVEVLGELDIATGAELRAALAIQAAERRSILLDLRGVEFMDSTGIRILIQAYERMRGDGLDFELITSEAVDHTLAVAGLGEHFPSVDSMRGPGDYARTLAAFVRGDHGSRGGPRRHRGQR